MSGEHEAAPSGWTTDTLKQYVDTRLAAEAKAVTAALAAAEKATNKAEDDVKAWRHQANEWRGAMSDREIQFATRREVDSDLAALRIRMDAMEKAAERGTGRSEGVRMSLGALVSVVTVAVIVLGVIIAFANYTTN